MHCSNMARGLLDDILNTCTKYFFLYLLKYQIIPDIIE
jgi:hypothetical protein